MKASTLQGIRYVLLTHLEFLYLRKWMHQNFFPHDREIVKFPGNTVLRPCTDEDFSKNPMLNFLTVPDKILYLLEGNNEEYLDKCTRIINVWYGEYKKEVAHYRVDVPKEFQPKSTASRSKLEQLQNKFSR